MMEYCTKKESLKILNIIFYKSDIKKIKVVDNLNESYENIE